MLSLGLVKVRAVDHDGDGMSDVWERAYEAESLDPSGDEDGDCFTNLQESIAWTDPFSARSKLELDLVAEGGGLVLEWRENEGVAYDVEASVDLTSWTTITSFQTTLPQPGGQTGETVDVWAPWLGGSQQLDPLWGLEHGFFLAAAAGPDFAMGADPDIDELTNLLESYAGIDPFDGNSRITASLLHTGAHLRIQWHGSDGSLRYQLQMPLAFEFFGEFDPGATGWVAFGSALGDYYGAEPDHRTGAFRIESFVPGEARTHESADFPEEMPGAPGVGIDPNQAVQFGTDPDGNSYFWWHGLDGNHYVVKMRVRLGDWYWGRAGSIATHQPGASNASYFRISAVAPADPTILTAAEWSMLTSGPHASEDWDSDRIPNKWEVDNQLDPMDPTDAVEDPDGDVLNNYEEYLDDRDPRVADTQTVHITCITTSSTDEGWRLERERWDLEDGWVELETVADEFQTITQVDHEFGERYRYTVVPGYTGAEIPTTQFDPHGDPATVYWQEEWYTPEFFEQSAGGKIAKAGGPPAAGSSSTPTYPTSPPPPPPISSAVRIFQTFLPRLNLPPCLLHNNNRDEYKPGGAGADFEDESLMMKHPLTGADTGVLMFNDLMTGTRRAPLLYVSPAAGTILQSPETDFRIVLNTPLPNETGRLRFHALRHRLTGKPLLSGQEVVMGPDVNLAGDFLVLAGQYYGWELFVEGIAEGLAPYSLEWRFDGSLYRVWSAETDVLARQLAFDDNLSTAEGFGKWSIGGRCGPEIAVTNTSDSGPGQDLVEGSLRWALEAPENAGPKRITFSTLQGGDGNISLKGPLNITEPFVTIEGQTAPGWGSVCATKG